MAAAEIVMVFIPSMGTMVAQVDDDNPHGGMRFKNLSRLVESPTGHELRFSGLAYYTPNDSIDMNMLMFLSYPAPPLVKNEFLRYLESLTGPHP